MIADEYGKQLHDRATRGVTLSADELEKLEAWYSVQDQAEAAALALESVKPSIAHLRSQAESTLEQAQEATNAIRRLFSENEALKNENSALRRKLDARALSQPA